MRLGGLPVVQQILYLILTPIELVTNDILSTMCNLVTSITAIVTYLQESIFETLIPMFASSTSITEVVIEILLVFANATISNITTVAPTYTCSMTSSASNVVDSIINAIIGIF